MGRPKYEQGDITAKRKIENAFWEMLSEMPFDKITARSLSKRAEVNHNTFYRYFSSIEQLAHEVFEESLIREIPAMLIQSDSANIYSPKIPKDSYRKALLYARSGSQLLIGILRNAIEKTWLETIGVSKESLTLSQVIDLDIIFGGITFLMGDTSIAPDTDTIANITSRPLGKEMVATLQAMHESFE